jgi:hypothetical protein
MPGNRPPVGSLSGRSYSFGRPFSFKTTRGVVSGEALERRGTPLKTSRICGASVCLLPPAPVLALSRGPNGSGYSEYYSACGVVHTLFMCLHIRYTFTGSHIYSAPQHLVFGVRRSDRGLPGFWVNTGLNIHASAYGLPRIPLPRRW